ncbi:MAG: hypothetical protein JXR03_12395 [Cyclobacteriaceae bacterium]
MSDDEFNVLDELYFVQSFDELIALSSYAEAPLLEVLKSLQKQDWIKILKDVDDEWPEANLTDDQIRSSFFLATKKGLLAHNS